MRDGSWFILCCVTTRTLSEVDGGLSALMAAVLRLFFGSGPGAHYGGEPGTRWDLHTTGMLIPVGGQQRHIRA
eukprot:6272401-Pyramimonas_sp.AAC.1